MRIRTIAVTIAVAALTALPLAGVAQAQTDRNCPDFATQREAQEALDARTGDPEGLDGDGNGYACESKFGKPQGRDSTPAAGPGDRPQVDDVPRGSVDTGDGSTEGAAFAPVALIGGMAAAGVGVIFVRRVLHRS